MDKDIILGTVTNKWELVNIQQLYKRSIFITILQMQVLSLEKYEGLDQRCVSTKDGGRICEVQSSHGYLSRAERRTDWQKAGLSLLEAEKSRNTEKPCRFIYKTKQNKTKHHKHVPKTNKQTNKQQNKLVAAGLGKGLL
jgi:hypothetical protein